MKKNKLLLWIAIPGALLVIAVMAFAIFEPIQVLPRIRLGPGFALTDQSALPFTSEDVRGDVVVYSFGYSGCGDDCSGMEDTTREVRDRLDEVDLGDVDVRFVTLTFDPSHDTADVISGVAERAGADGVVWRYATGEPQHMENVVRSGFKARYSPEDDGSFSFDPMRILVMDGE